ncbi:outer membrane beta-barrel protein [Fibrella aquatica]|uniref:outer membrane beta-barrel protein n=1 Tax=Fibrella aquatica TaxID=3242487 RepID=UPI003522FD0E
MSRLYLYIVLCLYLSQLAFAQSTANKWSESIGDHSVGVHVSTSRYCGDLSERYNLAHLQFGWGIEGHYRYRFHERWCLMSDIGLYHIRATQQYTKNAANQLSFYATNFSVNTRVKWDMLSPEVGNLWNVFYLFGGVGATTLSPSTLLNNTVYSLPDFKTEGNEYALWAAQVNYGLGFPMALNKSTLLSIEGRYTHVRTDYLDDVSTVYVDKSASSELERNLADKRIAFGLPPNVIGATRGNPAKNDGYFLLTLQIIHKFR